MEAAIYGRKPTVEFSMLAPKPQNTGRKKVTAYIPLSKSFIQREEPKTQDALSIVEKKDFEWEKIFEPSAEKPTI